MRHGAYRQPSDVPSAHLPSPLIPQGESQAQEGAVLIRRIADENHWQIHRVIDCSTLLRGWQTAQALAESLNQSQSTAIQIEQYDSLAERGLGAAANLTIQEIEATIKEDPRFDELPSKWKSDSHFKLPLIGAESLMEAGTRVAAHVLSRVSEMTLQESSDTLKIFVGHGAAFRHAAAEMGVLSLDQVAGLSMYHCRPVFLERLPDGGWSHIAGDWKVRPKQQEILD